MKRRKIDPETKMAAVLEGLKGESSVAEICRKYQISESLYYRWRDKFLEGGSRALSSRNGSGTELASAQVNTLRLKLLKIGARIRETSRRIWVHLASGYPYCDLLAGLLQNLRASPGLISRPQALLL